MTVVTEAMRDAMKNPNKASGGGNNSGGTSSNTSPRGAYDSPLQGRSGRAGIQSMLIRSGSSSASLAAAATASVHMCGWQQLAHIRHKARGKTKKVFHFIFTRTITLSLCVNVWVYIYMFWPYLNVIISSSSSSLLHYAISTFTL